MAGRNYRLRLFSIIALALVIMNFGCSSEPELKAVTIAQGEHLQDRALTEQMFASMKESGVSPAQPLLWGYFFFGDEQQLRQVWEKIKGDGYKLVRLEATEPEPGEGPTAILHVEKKEQHTVDSLLQRNKEFSEIASPLGVVYDGMDVGPPDAR